MTLIYNAPPGNLSSMDVGSSGTGDASNQMNSFYYLKKALIEARKEQYFTPLASTTNMPKHFGKTIKVYEYVPLLDDRNQNDQGIDADGATIGVDGNLYGSSKDIGTIVGKLPTLSENGGRVNRVGFTRLQREGSLSHFGFFYEFTKEALSFDSDSELKTHLSRELMDGAVELYEAVLQQDLLVGANAAVWTGAASSMGTVSGDTGPGEDPSVVTYDDFMRLDQILTDNRTPKKTTVITGSRLIDTKTIPAARIAYVGSELVPLLRRMTDPFGNPAFIAVQHYADATNVLPGEIGSIDAFRIIQVPEMLHWAAAGGADTANKNPGYRSSNKGSGVKYDVFPILVVGDDSFTTIGFQTDGKSGKFGVITKMPGVDTASYNDPFGQVGFSSIMWYYGTLITRPDRIGIIYTVAPE